MILFVSSLFACSVALALSSLALILASDTVAVTVAARLLSHDDDDGVFDGVFEDVIG
jgi:hypothetical protein